MPRTASALLAAVLLTAFAPGLFAADKPVGRRIDVVICLDTSNSMDGLIASAKTKLWDVVNELARAQPTPDLRVALYSYGNDHYPQQVGWVRKDLDLTTDLDALYQKLNALTTRGGTELVARVCRAALQEQKWADDPKALRIIFVCGNEPAGQDPQHTLASVADLAKGKDVVINPVFCGDPHRSDAQDWKSFAEQAGGRFASIDQSRGAVAIATPHDKELSELSSKLNTTYVAYGRLGQEKALNQSAQDANAAKAGLGASAGRSVSKANALYRNEDWDLVDRVKNDPKFDVKKVPEAELCDEMKKLAPEAREKHVKDMLAKREGLQKQINDLNVKRQTYINEEAKKNPTKADKAFDEAVKGALREQAAKKEIKIPE